MKGSIEKTGCKNFPTESANPFFARKLMLLGNFQYPLILHTLSIYSSHFYLAEKQRRLASLYKLTQSGMWKLRETD